MSNAQIILDSNEGLIRSFTIRSILSTNNFFNEDIFKKIIDYILNYPKLSSYVSSYSISEANKEIQISMRKTYFNRFNENRYNTLLLYNMIDNCLKETMMQYNDRLDEMFSKSELGAIYNNTSTLYDVFRTDENTIVIKFL